MFRASARWVSHVSGVGAPAGLRDWLSDRVSLTRKLMDRSHRFRVQRLRQRHGRCLRDECGTIGLPRRQIVREREVLLRCDERPVVFAHTIVPLGANASDWPFFSALGERSLGTTLFGDPKVRRGELEYAKLHADHPLARRALEAVGVEQYRFPLFARRCLFRRNNGLLLVTEVFLPALHELPATRLSSSQDGTDQLPHRAVNQYNKR
ncbi:MAG: chorismate--pyruvate lyase family protein [Burkholderiaceae bacterium]